MLPRLCLIVDLLIVDILFCNRPMQEYGLLIAYYDSFWNLGLICFHLLLKETKILLSLSFHLFIFLSATEACCMFFLQLKGVC